MQFTIDDDAVGTLVLDYEFTVSRTKDSDGQGRTWHVPSYTHGLLSAEFSAPGSSRSMKWAFKSGKEMDGRTEAEKEADGVGHTLQLSATARVSDLLTVSLLPSTTELVLLYAQSCQLKAFHPLQPLRADTCLRTVLSRSGACV